MKNWLFYDLVKHTLQTEIIQDLREITIKVLHYYKDDFSDELPRLENVACKFLHSI